MSLKIKFKTDENVKSDNEKQNLIKRLLFINDKSIFSEIKKDSKQILLNQNSYHEFFNNMKKIQNIKIKDEFAKFKSRNIKIKTNLSTQLLLPELKIRRYNSNPNISEENYNNILKSNRNYIGNTINNNNINDNNIIKNIKILSSFSSSNLKPLSINKSFKFITGIESNKYIKDNSLLISDSVLTKNNSELIYDERMIFSRMNPSLKDHYKKFIFDKINYYKKNENNNQTYILTKEFKDKENNFILRIKSLQIKFENIQTKNIKKLNLPFNYLPIFYFNHFQYFRYVLLSLIQFSNDFENITFDEKKMRHFIKNSVIFKEKTNISDLTTLIHLNLYSTTLLKNENKYEKEINLKGNSYNFLWNTPKYIYKVYIRLPLIQAYFLKINHIIEHHANTDIMCFLLERNFLNWDFYITKYFISFKLFRYYFKENLSKSKNYYFIIKNGNNDFCSNKDTVKLRITPLKNINFIDLSNNKKFFLYFETNKFFESKINIIHGFKLEIYHFDKYFDFAFSFNHMKIISIISKYENLRFFFLKILYVDKSNLSIKLDYKFFYLFNEQEFKNIYHRKGKGIFLKKLFKRQLSYHNVSSIKNQKLNNNKETNTNNSNDLNLTIKKEEEENEEEDSIKIDKKNTHTDYIDSNDYILDLKKTKKDSILIFHNPKRKKNLTEKYTGNFIRKDRRTNTHFNPFKRKNLYKLSTFNHSQLKKQNELFNGKNYSKKPTILVPTNEKEQYGDLKLENLFIYNPFIETYKILNNNIETNTSRNIRYEIKIKDFKSIIDIPKYLIPQFINDNPQLIERKDDFGEFEEESIQFNHSNIYGSPPRKSKKRTFNNNNTKLKINFRKSLNDNNYFYKKNNNNEKKDLLLHLLD